MFDCPNVVLANIEIGSNRPLRPRVLPNFSDLVWSKFPALIAAICEAEPVSVFSHHISAIVANRSGKQVVRIDATSVVAMMANYQAVRDGPFVALIRKTMRPLGLPIPVERSVSVAHPISAPFPTIGFDRVFNKLVKLFPEIYLRPFSTSTHALYRAPFRRGLPSKLRIEASIAVRTDECNSGISRWTGRVARRHV